MSRVKKTAAIFAGVIAVEALVMLAVFAFMNFRGPAYPWLERVFGGYVHGYENTDASQAPDSKQGRVYQLLTDECENLWKQIDAQNAVAATADDGHYFGIKSYSINRRVIRNDKNLVIIELTCSSPLPPYTTYIGQLWFDMSGDEPIMARNSNLDWYNNTLSFSIPETAPEE